MPGPEVQPEWKMPDDRIYTERMDRKWQRKTKNRGRIPKN